MRIYIYEAVKNYQKETFCGRSYGQVTVRHQGGQHKRFIRLIDFKRDKREIDGKVMSIE